jgi:hypothetical protein
LASIPKNIKPHEIENVLNKMFSPEWLRDTATKVGFIQRNRKIDPVTFFWVVVLGFGVGMQRTLASLRRAYEAASAETLVPSSFYDRFSNGLVAFLKECLAHGIAELSRHTSLSLSDKLKGFKDLVVSDGSIIRLHDKLAEEFPGARGKAELKIHVATGITSNTKTIAIYSGKTAEVKTMRIGPWVKDNILLFDLGYFKYELFSKIRDNGGYFVSRPKKSANPTIVSVVHSHRDETSDLADKKLKDILPQLKQEVIDVEVEISLLLKKGQPQNLREVLKNTNTKKRKVKKLLSEEASLISDGRFIQLDNGYWGLTEWEVETSHYSLKNLVIKAMKIHPGGLSLQQLHKVINSWRETDIKTLEGVLRKLPYFELAGEEVWSYNPTIRVLYEDLLKKFLLMINKQKTRWHRSKAQWKSKYDSIQKHYQEAVTGKREAAAALAEKMELEGQHEYLLTQMAEKDLLLSLRKREILRYREHINKLEAKSNSILYQCRLWVKRTKEAQEEIARQKELLAKTQGSLEGLFTKLQQYKEKDRENKARLAEMKEQHSTRIAELQTEIVELKQKADRERTSHIIEQRRMQEEINALSNDLKKSLRMEEEQQRSYLLAQQELAAAREENKDIERRLKNPLVRFIIKICGFFGKYYRQSF